ncbi:MAG: UDP-N-acetylmuramoyl-L-alanyl-D-glutamate synthetase [Pseudomonadota bacterium]|jgi:UDP-N-acetylmuramoylalanine--D-glutamate ligase
MNHHVAHRRALIVGLGKTGVSAARHFAARGWHIAVTDTRTEPPGREQLASVAPQAECCFGRLDTALLEGSQIVVASPGIALREPLIAEALARGIEVVGDVELFAREAKAPVVGITGTNGKSTVTTLVGRMAARAGRVVSVGGNLGTPVLDLLSAPVPELYVLELSSFQLETTSSLNLVAATVLNLSEDHLDRHGTMDAYAAAKARIFRRCGTAVINVDDPWVRSMSTGSAKSVVGFSIEGASTARYSLIEHGGEPWLAIGGQPVLAVSAMRLAGLHNAANALAALALGDACGLPLPPMIDELREFAGLPHRSQWVGEKRGVRYINDSKGTNVGATVATVSGMTGTLLLIAGGDGKGQDFTPLAKALKGRARAALLIGRDAAQLANALEGCCEIVRCASLEEAVDEAAHRATAGDVVLLSPACASLDMFRDYTERGDRFAAAVGRLLT